MKKYTLNIFNLSILTLSFSTMILVILINTFLFKTFKRDIDIFLLMNKESVGVDIKKIDNYYISSITELFIINDLLRFSNNNKTNTHQIEIQENQQITKFINNRNFTVLTFDNFSLEKSVGELNSVLNAIDSVYKSTEGINKQIVYISINDFMVILPQKKLNPKEAEFYKELYLKNINKTKKEYVYNPSPVVNFLPIFFDKFKNSRIDTGSLTIPNEKGEFIGQLFLLTPLNNLKNLITKNPLHHDILFVVDTKELLYSSNYPMENYPLIDDFLKKIYGKNFKEITSTDYSKHYVSLLEKDNVIFLRIVEKEVLAQRKHDLIKFSLIINLLIFLLFSYLIIVLFKFRKFDLERLRLIELQNSTDDLTKLYNRKAILQELDDSFSLNNLSIALIDIDRFKSINDTYGHVFGDLVIKQITKLIKKIVGEKGSVGRYGGEEFIIIMPNTNLQNAEVLCKKINEIISDKSYILMYKKVTVSIGVSYKTNEANPKELIEKADKNLYRAKDSGRNRVVSS